MNLTPIILREAVDLYLSELAERGRAANTLDAYGYDLGLYTAWLAEAGVTYAAAITAEQVGRYCAVQAEGNPWTAARRCSVLAGWHRWLHRSNYHAEDLAGHIRRPRVPQYRERVVSVEDVRRIVTRAEAGTRDRAVLELLALGVLPLEIANLRLVDFDGAAGTLVVGAQGGTRSSKPRTVDLSASAWAAVKAYLVHGRAEYLKRPTDLLFMTREGAYMGRQTALNILKAAGRKAGVDMSANDLRRSRIVHMTAEGHPVSYIQAQIGHAVAGTTSKYAALAKGA